MPSTDALAVVRTPRSPEPVDQPPSTERLGQAIAELAARLHAATYELLVLLREFDGRAGWNGGFMSCAHWLHWRTGIDLGAAHVERFVRAWRRVDRVAEARQAEAQHLGRTLSTWVDDDGMVVIRGRLTPEVGAVVQSALEAAADRLFREAADTPTGGAMDEEMTAGQRRADALGLLAEAPLEADLDRGSAGDHYQVVLHVEASAPASDVSAPGGEASEPRSSDGALEVADGTTYVSAETSRRLACDASVVVMRHDASGTVLDVGRRTRTIPTAIRRALLARDTCCRFPGCTARRCDAHHVVHWVDGGATRLESLVRLCRRHHRAVHEGGFAMVQQPDGATLFFRPDGRRLEEAPALPQSDNELDRAATGIAIDPGSVAVWDGTPFDVAWAIDVVRGGASAVTSPPAGS